MIWLVLLLLVTMPLFYWLGRLTLLYTQIGTLRTMWLAWNKTASSPEQLLYVALGDSTAQGIGAGDPKKSYPYLLKEWLEAQTGRPVKLINLSVSGAKLANVLAYQLDELKKFKPDVVTIEIGANDMRTFDANVFKAEFAELVSRLPRGAFVSDVPAFTGRSKKLDPMVRLANQIIQDLLKTSKVEYVRLYDMTKQNHGLNYFAADFFHPNARAYKNWATAFEATMSERFFQKIR